MRKSVWVLMTAALMGAIVVAAEKGKEPETIDETISRLLTSSGAVSYASKQPYGAGIERMAIGFGKDDKPVVALVVRDTKTYKQAKAVVAVTPGKDGYTVAAAEIPAVGEFHGKSQTLTKDALKDITGQVFENEKEARGLVDAVTGATKYYKAIYVSYALMASKAIEELSNVPDWPRKPVQP
jgi:hypothetical protein